MYSWISFQLSLGMYSSRAWGGSAKGFECLGSTMMFEVRERGLQGTKTL